MKVVFSKKVKYKGEYHSAGIEFDIDPTDMQKMVARGGVILEDTANDTPNNPQKKSKAAQKKDG